MKRGHDDNNSRQAGSDRAWCAHAAHCARVVVPWVVQVDNLGQARAVAPSTADYRPADSQVAWHLVWFIEQVRSIPADPVIGRQNWLRGYEWTTDRGFVALTRYDRCAYTFISAICIAATTIFWL